MWCVISSRSARRRLCSRCSGTTRWGAGSPAWSGARSGSSPTCWWSGGGSPPKRPASSPAVSSSCAPIRETTDAIAQRSAESLLGLARDAFAACDVVVLSDYAKGVLPPELVRQLIETAQSAARPVVVDPKGRDFARYAGATVLTPNRAELGFAAGESLETDDAIVVTCRDLIARHRLGAILVTRSRDGMTVVSARRSRCPSRGGCARSVRRLPAREIRWWRRLPPRSARA